MKSWKEVILLSFAFALVFGCSDVARKNPEDAQKEIEQLMQLQEQAWNNGDIKTFMLPYDPSDSLLFVSKSGVKTGWQRILENYQNAYPSQKEMGQLQFINSHYKSLGDKYIQVIGQWQLHRETDSVGGFYTLIWEFRDGKWFIISDHTS